MKSEISRRNFLKVSGAAGIGSAMVLGGCTPKVASTMVPTETGDEIEGKAEQLNITETMECDVIVAGTGAAGMAAAVRASELGARVIAIENNNFLGGTSLFGEGMFGVESSIQKEMGITHTR